MFCEAPLDQEDGRDLHPMCLGPEHLWEGFSDNPYMDCSCLFWGLRAARLVEVEGPGDESDLPPLEQAPLVLRRYSKLLAEATIVAPSRKKAQSDQSRLSLKVMELSA